MFPFVPSGPEVDSGPYAVLVVAGAMGVALVAALPWGRLLETSAGDYIFYVWSAFDIGLIALAAAASGGGHSPVVLLYFATTLFFVSSYPRLGQAVLLVLTFVAWLVMIALTGENPGAAVLVVQFSSLGVVAFLGSFLSGELVGQMRALVGARSESQRRAKLLATVAGAASSISTADRTKVARFIFLPQRAKLPSVDALVHYETQAPVYLRLSAYAFERRERTCRDERRLPLRRGAPGASHRRRALPLRRRLSRHRLRLQRSGGARLRAGMGALAAAPY